MSFTKRNKIEELPTEFLIINDENFWKIHNDCKYNLVNYYHTKYFNPDEGIQQGFIPILNIQDIMYFEDIPGVIQLIIYKNESSYWWQIWFDGNEIGHGNFNIEDVKQILFNIPIDNTLNFDINSYLSEEREIAPVPAAIVIPEDVFSNFDPVEPTRVIPEVFDPSVKILNDGFMKNFFNVLTIYENISHLDLHEQSINFNKNYKILTKNTMLTCIYITNLYNDYKTTTISNYIDYKLLLYYHLYHIKHICSELGINHYNTEIRLLYDEISNIFETVCNLKNILIDTNCDPSSYEKGIEDIKKEKQPMFRLTEKYAFHLFLRSLDELYSLPLSYLNMIPIGQLMPYGIDWVSYIITNPELEEVVIKEIDFKNELIHNFPEKNITYKYIQLFYNFICINNYTISDIDKILFYKEIYNLEMNTIKNMDNYKNIFKCNEIINDQLKLKCATFPDNILTSSDIMHEKEFLGYIPDPNNFKNIKNENERTIAVSNELKYHIVGLKTNEIFFKNLIPSYNTKYRESMKTENENFKLQINVKSIKYDDFLLEKQKIYIQFPTEIRSILNETDVLDLQIQPQLAAYRLQKRQRDKLSTTPEPNQTFITPTRNPTVIPPSGAQSFFEHNLSGNPPIVTPNGSPAYSGDTQNDELSQPTKLEMTISTKELLFPELKLNVSKTQTSDTVTATGDSQTALGEERLNYDGIFTNAFRKASEKDKLFIPVGGFVLSSILRDDRAADWIKQNYNLLAISICDLYDRINPTSNEEEKKMNIDYFFKKTFEGPIYEAKKDGIKETILDMPLYPTTAGSNKKTKRRKLKITRRRKKPHRNTKYNKHLNQTLKSR